MVKESGLGIISVIFSLSCVISVFAQEQFTITTYYPSPYGSYRELTTTGNTYLATTSGSVGIKTTSPERDVHIANGNGLLITSGVDANTTYLILTGVSPASTYAEIFAWDNNFGARNLAINRGGGNVGIGTVNPTQKLTIGSNGSILVSQGGSGLGLGSTRWRGANNAIAFYSSNSEASAPGASYGVLYLAAGSLIYRGNSTRTNIAPADIAESMHTLGPVENADIVSVSQTPRETTSDDYVDKIYNTFYVEKSQKAYDSSLIGVVSSEGQIQGQAPADLIGTKQVALVGRVPTKVSTINGPIKIGDSITSSEIPGVGMKATKRGPIVGKALEPYDNPDPSAIGKILVFVNLSWYDPDTLLNSAEDLFIEKGKRQNYDLKAKTGEIIERVGNFAQATIANVKAGTIEAKKLVVEGVDVLGKLQKVSDTVEKQQRQIEEQQKFIEELKR